MSLAPQRASLEAPLRGRRSSPVFISRGRFILRVCKFSGGFDVAAEFGLNECSHFLRSRCRVTVIDIEAEGVGRHRAHVVGVGLLLIGKVNHSMR